nr:ribonuclease H-like domain-containing protein [Tanacetum cinerariifolium]
MTGSTITPTTTLSDKLDFVTYHHLLTQVPVKLDFEEWNTGTWNMNTGFPDASVLLRCDSTGDLYPVTALSPIPNAFLLGKHVRLSFVSSNTMWSALVLTLFTQMCGHHPFRAFQVVYAPQALNRKKALVQSEN